MTGPPAAKRPPGSPRPSGRRYDFPASPVRRCVRCSGAPFHDRNRRDGLDLTVRRPHKLPSSLVNEPVMTMTEEDKIVEIRGPALSPVLDVMGVNPQTYVEPD